MKINLVKINDYKPCNDFGFPSTVATGFVNKTERSWKHMDHLRESLKQFSLNYRVLFIIRPRVRKIAGFFSASLNIQPRIIGHTPVTAGENCCYGELAVYSAS